MLSLFGLLSGFHRFIACVSVVQSNEWSRGVS